MERLSRKFTLNPSKLVQTSLVLRTIAFILMVFCIPLESILSNQLMEWQEEFVENLQSNFRSDGLDSFAEGMMVMGDHWVILLISPFIFHFIDTRLSLKAILFFCYSVYIYSITALLTREPRPFWVDEDITGINCERGFGSPSKETMLGISVFAVLCIECFHSYKLWVRVIVYSSVVILQIVIGASAIYLGAHFPHQVLMGVIYSTIYLTACFAFDKQCTKIILKSGFSYNKNRMSILYWFIGTIVLFLSVITVFDVITLGNLSNLKWLRAASVTSIQIDCTYKYELGVYSFFDSAFIFYAYSVVTSSILATKYLNDYWWFTVVWKKLARAVLGVGVSIAVVMLFSKMYSGLIPVYDVTTEYTFHYVLPYLIAPMMYAGLLPIAAGKMNLAFIIRSEIPDYDRELIELGRGNTTVQDSP